MVNNVDFSSLDLLISKAKSSESPIFLTEVYSYFTFDLDEEQIDLVVKHIEKSGVRFIDTRVNLSTSDKDIPSDSLALYLSSLNRFKVLNREEEKALFIRYAMGDLLAKNEIVNHNLRLVVSIARQYTNNSLSLIDLIQEGNIGLIEAISRFDYKTDNRFATYATYWIRRSVSNSISSFGSSVQLPATVGNNLRKIFRTAKILQERYDRQPTSKEISDYLKNEISEETIDFLLISSNDPISLDAEINYTDLHEAIGDELNQGPDVVTQSLVDFEIVESVIETLSPRERFVLSKRFGLDDNSPLTLEQIGRTLSLTREAVRYIEKQIILKIRKALKIN